MVCDSRHQRTKVAGHAYLGLLSTVIETDRAVPTDNLIQAFGPLRRCLIHTLIIARSGNPAEVSIH